jgi:hypothetical protein
MQKYVSDWQAVLFAMVEFSANSNIIIGEGFYACQHPNKLQTLPLNRKY